MNIFAPLAYAHRWNTTWIVGVVSLSSAICSLTIPVSLTEGKPWIQTGVTVTLLLCALIVKWYQAYQTMHGGKP